MTVTDHIGLTLKSQDIVGKQRCTIAGGNAGGKAAMGGLDVAIAMVNADDGGIVECNGVHILIHQIILSSFVLLSKSALVGS